MEKAGEMFQCLTMQTALPEGPSSAPRIRTGELTTACKSSSRGLSTLLASADTAPIPSPLFCLIFPECRVIFWGVLRTILLIVMVWTRSKGLIL